MWPVFLSSSYFAREPRGISTKTSTWSDVALRGMASPCVPVRRRDDHRDLPFGTLGSIPSRKVARRPAHERLVQLGELARDDDARIGREGRDIGEEVAGAIWALIHDDRPALGDEGAEERVTLSALLRKEAEERERASGEARGHERRDRRIRAGDRRDRVAGRDGRDHERFSRIRQRRSAGIRDERHVPPSV